MGTHHLIDADGRRYGIMTVPNVYQYKGFTFELHTFFGPVKVNKDFNPSACMGRKFFKVFDEWNKLSDLEKLDTLIFG
jgi:hypothetical protein